MERINPFCTSCHYDNILDKIVVSFTTKLFAAVVVLISLLGPSCSELTFLAFDISGSIYLLGSWDHHINQESDFTVLFDTAVYFLPPTCPMMQTLSTLVMKRCQDGMIALCWSWHCNMSVTSRRLVASQSLISGRLVAEDFRAKVLIYNL